MFFLVKSDEYARQNAPESLYWTPSRESLTKASEEYQADSMLVVMLSSEKVYVIKKLIFCQPDE